MILHRNKASAGFTLVEIIIVVVVLGILAATAIPRVMAPNERIRASEGKNVLIDLLRAQRSYYLENSSTYASSLASLDVTIPASSNFGVPTVSVDANAVAYIPSSRLNYTLLISDTGAFDCTDTDGGVSCAQACKGGTVSCN